MGFPWPAERSPQALCGVAALCLLSILTGNCVPLAAQDPAAPVAEIAADAPGSLSVHPREYQQVNLKLIANEYNELRLDVGQAASRGIFIKAIVQLPGQPDSDPYISDNAESFLRIPILPDPQTTSATLKVTVLNSSKANVAPVTVSMALSAAPLSAETTHQAEALSAFAHAERLRREHKPAAEALPSYDHAFAVASGMHDASFMQQILMSKARFLLLDGQHYVDALEVAKQAVAVPVTGDDPMTEGMTWKTLGSAYLDLDRYDESIEASKRALAILHKAGNLYWENILLDNLGDAYRENGDLLQALATDKEALQLAHELHDDYGVIEMLSELGGISTSRGAYQQALNFFSQAVEIALPSGYITVQGEAWANLGSLDLVLNDPDGAQTAYQKALAIARSTKDRPLELGALEELGDLELDRSKPQEAASDFSSGLQIARELDMARATCGLSIGLARASSVEQKYDAANELLAGALETATRMQLVDEQAAAYQAMGEIAAAQKEWKNAAGAYSRSASLWQQAPDRARQIAALSRLASIEYEQDDLNAARTHTSQAMDLIESSRGSIARGALRTRFFTSRRETYDLAIRVLMKLDSQTPGKGFAAAAWQVAERARARSLLDDLESASRENAPAQGDPLQKRLAALDSRIEDLRDKLTSLGSSAADAQKAQALSRDVHAALLEENEIESRRALLDVAAQPAQQPLTAQQFASRVLDGTTALVEYWSGDHSDYLWVLTSKGDCRGFSLDHERITKEAAAFHQSLSSRVKLVPTETLAQRDARFTSADAQVRAVLLQLADAILPTDARNTLTGMQALVVIADGPMLSVPFSALPAGPRASYLIERYEIISEPSAAAMAALRDRSSSANHGDARIAVFADPVYTRADTRFRTALAENSAPEGLQRAFLSVDFSRLPRLPGSYREAESIAAIAGKQNTSLYLGFDATPAAVMAADRSRYGIAHFAAHIVSRPDYPELSGIVLSMVDKEGNSRDGVLWLKDILQSHTTEDLIVLSGCDSATGAFIPGEGMNGLVRAFLTSGARQVVATLWAADDVASSALMTSFYQAFLTQHLSASAALRKAQRTMLATEGRSAPYYWAGFQVEGAWQSR